MINREHPLPIAKQCLALNLPRSTAYYKPCPLPENDLAIMQRMDKLHRDYPFAGSRMLRDMLLLEGYKIGRRHVRTLMSKMDIHAVYRKPNTSLANKQHKIYPYLLKDLVIDKPNEVFACDITYIPMAKGFVYLMAVIDWYTRRVMAWRLSNTLTTDFCLEALDEAITRYGVPKIFNTDQGSQFTSEAFTTRLKEYGIQISMDGKGRWVDNVFVERLWRSVKYEEVYLKAYASMAEAKQGLRRYFSFYNSQRPHQGLNGKTPDDVYFSGFLPTKEVA
jgi:putative transposase